MPTGILEEFLEPDRLDVGNDAVEALPVEVDDQHDVAQPGDGRFDDRLPHVAFVEFGVPDGRDEPGRTPRIEVSIHVPSSCRRENRSNCTQTHRSRREVGDIGILRS